MTQHKEGEAILYLAADGEVSAVETSVAAVKAWFAERANDKSLPGKPLMPLLPQSDYLAVKSRLEEAERERDEARISRRLIVAAEIETAETALASARAENEALREGLRPFADEADQWSDDVPEAFRPGITEPGYSQAHANAKFTLGDLRRARALLKEPKE